MPPFITQVNAAAFAPCYRVGMSEEQASILRFDAAVLRNHELMEERRFLLDAARRNVAWARQLIHETNSVRGLATDSSRLTIDPPLGELAT